MFAYHQSRLLVAYLCAAALAVSTTARLAEPTLLERTKTVATVGATAVIATVVQLAFLHLLSNNEHEGAATDPREDLLTEIEYLQAAAERENLAHDAASDDQSLTITEYQPLSQSRTMLRIAEEHFTSLSSALDAPGTRLSKALLHKEVGRAFSPPQTNQDILLSLREGGLVHLTKVCTKGDRPVGFINYTLSIPLWQRVLRWLHNQLSDETLSTAPLMRIAHLAIDTEHQASGCGSRLLQHALSHSNDLGCYKVKLQTTDKGNVAGDTYALGAFYRKHGFKEGQTIGHKFGTATYWVRTTRTSTSLLGDMLPTLALSLFRQLKK